MGLVLLIFVVVLLFGSLPAWPHSRRWGYRGPGISGAVLVVLLSIKVLPW